jgi:hypothetical protein
MRKRVFVAVLAAAVLVFTASAYLLTTSAQGNGPAANGHGTLVLPDGTRRQFSFNARQHADGTVTGHAVIHNPGFDFRSQLDITCLRVEGNGASFGGSVRRSNDPFFEGQNGFFTVFDNGEPGKNTDTISLVFFDAQVGPEACQQVAPADFPQQPIDAGNIQVRP